MPSKSKAQAKTMRAIAHGWKPKGSVKGIPIKIAKEFEHADEARGSKSLAKLPVRKAKKKH